MTLLKDNNYKDINVALLSLEADIKNKITNFDTSEIDKQLAEINSRIDKINTSGGNSSSDEIEDINSKLNSNSNKIRNLEQNIGDIDTRINGIEQKLSDIFSAENKVTDFNTTTNSGVYYWVTDAANRPSDYGVLLVNKYYNGGDITTGLWVNQVAYGTNNKIYFRQNINSGSWTEWKAVAFDGELTAKKVANALTVNGKTYDGSEAVDAGVQTVANGGTGATDAASGFNTLADGVRDASTPADNEKMLLKPTGTWYKTTCMDFWNYIKGKISSVLGLTKDTYGGKAASAGTADKATSDANGNNIVNTYATKTELEKTTTKSVSLNTVSTNTTKYIKLGTFRWFDSFSFGCRIAGNSFEDNVNINILGGISNASSVCGYYSTNSRLTKSIIVKRGEAWNSDFEIYLKIVQLTTANVFVTIDKYVQDRINISESTTAPSGTLEEIVFNNLNGMFSGNIDAKNLSGKASTAETADSLFYRHGNEINFKGGAQPQCWFNYRNADTEGPSPVNTMEYRFCNYSGDTSKSVLMAGSFNGTTAKASSKMVIPIGAPSQLEDGCIWIER